MQLGPQILLAAGGQLLDPAELAAASGGSTQAHENLGDGTGVRCGDRSAKHTARRAPTMPRSGALAAAARPKGKGSGGAMQGRPLRCQHGRRWSQSGRGWQGYILAPAKLLERPRVEI